MQSAKALQIKGLSGGNSDEKISEFASYLAQQQQQQHQQQQQQQQQHHQFQQQPQQQQPMPLLQSPIPTPNMTSLSPMSIPMPNVGIVGKNKRSSMEEFSLSRMTTSNAAKKRRSKNRDEHGLDLVIGFFF